jgi:RNA polymerase sigma-70 factor (ECF subfamily)
MRWHEKEEEIAFEQRSGEFADAAPVFSDEEIKDDQLRLIFACCHPALTPESQIALTLKLLCGFNVEEIARAFLASTETIAKRLTRARERLRTNAVPFEIPSGPELKPRLDSVLDVLYLLFNEGYNASHGEDLIRRDLGEEAIRLTTLLAEHSAGNTPKTQALLALLLFQAARFSARTDSVGEILLLQDQDRSVWDRQKISRAFYHLERASSGAASEFHLQAGIAASHCAAESYQATDWQKILLLYDLLLELNDSPIIALNRAVALARVRGAQAGLSALDEIKNPKPLENYYLLYAVRGDLESELGQHAEARKNYQHALRLTSVPAERNFLKKKLSN